MRAVGPQHRDVGDTVHRKGRRRWWVVLQMAGLVPKTARSRHRHKECSVRCKLAQRFPRVRLAGEAGMTTAEYAVGTLAACAFAAVLLAVVRSGGVKSALASVITAALGMAS
ncbi:DUF4244 domain-containing protein [Phycicoccus sp. Root563]|uniref:DUF4244 domain-containing protein n=2 Tax=unclassified Phycicoccus TaxID=2637926 RepID=UPI000A6F57A5